MKGQIHQDIGVLLPKTYSTFEQTPVGKLPGQGHLGFDSGSCPNHAAWLQGSTGSSSAAISGMPAGPSAALLPCTFQTC